MSSIKISELNNLSQVTSDDFMPVVDSGSLTTFRVSMATLGAWMAASGSALSASYAPVPVSQQFWQTSSNSPNNISNVNSGKVGINTLTPGSTLDVNGNINAVSVTASHHTGTDFTASISGGKVGFLGTASVALNAVSSSFATTALTATTATTAGSSTTAVSASYALSASYAANAGHANNADVATTAGSANTSISASYAANSNPNFIKAFATFVMSGSFTNTSPNNHITILDSYNISNIIINSGQISTWMNNTGYYFTVTFTTPLANNKYFVLGTGGEAGGDSIEPYVVVAPPNSPGKGTVISPAYKTTSQFSFTLTSVGADRTSNENAFCHLVVYGQP